MNNREILEAIQGVDEIGCLSPDASPPDILGVLAHSIYPKIPWSTFSSIKFVMEKVKDKFDINSQDICELLNLSERALLSESPEERRDRLLNVFAGRVEREDLLASGDVNSALQPEDFPLNEKGSSNDGR